MSNRLAAIVNIPAKYINGWQSTLVQSLRSELSRLTAFSANVSWNPPSLSAGASAIKAITVTGVKANTLASVRVFAPYALSGLSVSGYVSADDAVTIVLANNTSGSVDLGAGTWAVIVENYIS